MEWVCLGRKFNLSVYTCETCGHTTFLKTDRLKTALKEGFFNTCKVCEVLGYDGHREVEREGSSES
jgi:hypothetical protein